MYKRQSSIPPKAPKLSSCPLSHPNHRSSVTNSNSLPHPALTQHGRVPNLLTPSTASAYPTQSLPTAPPPHRTPISTSLRDHVAPLSHRVPIPFPVGPLNSLPLHPPILPPQVSPIHFSAPPPRFLTFAQAVTNNYNPIPPFVPPPPNTTNPANVCSSLPLNQPFRH